MPRADKTRRQLTEQLRNVGNRAGSAIVSAAGRATSPNRGAWRCRGESNQPAAATVFDRWARDARMARLEAVLFLAREPINTRKLAQFAGLADGTEARTLVRRLNRCYDESGSAFRAEELAGGFQLMSRAKFGPWLRRLVSSPVETRLSTPAQETLAVVAYRQPVMRAEIEAIRGVDCGEILRQLMDRDLVRTAGRANELGRPYWYATTKRFLQVFGLRHLDDLPRADLLRETAMRPPGDQAAPIPNSPRFGETVENLSPCAREDEEVSDRDHHRPN